MKKYIKIINILLIINFLILAISFPTNSYAVSTINTVYISGIDNPEVGKTPDLTASTGKGYSVDSIEWYDKTDERYMENEDKFVFGHKYDVVVWIEADSNYEFNYKSSYEPNVAGYINSKAATVYKAYGYNAWAMIEVRYTFDLSILKKIEISGGALPKIGENAPAKNSWEIPENSHYTKSDKYEWYNVTDDDYLHGAFKAGKVYKLTMSFIPNYMYSFEEPENMTVVLTDFASSNYTTKITKGGAGNASRMVEFTFNKLPSNEIKINNVTINNGAFPIAGENPDYTWSVSNSSNYSIVGTPYWASPNEGNRTLDPTDTFVKGQTYALFITLTPNVGYCFNDANSINIALADISDLYYLIDINCTETSIHLWLHMTAKNPTYTVRFESNGGTTINSQTVERGEKAIRPNPDPTKDGSTFVNWYKGSRLNYVYDFNQPVTSDFTLYAKWEENVISGTIDAINATSDNAKNPIYGDKMYLPTININSVTPDKYFENVYPTVYWIHNDTNIYKEDISNGNLKFENGDYSLRIIFEKDSDNIEFNYENFPDTIILNGITFNMDACNENFISYMKSFEVKNETILPFTDIKESDWYYAPVKYTYEKGLILGTTNTTFSPNGKFSRAQLVTILWRMEGTPTVGTNKFLDIRESDWYYKAVNWAASKKIVNGYASGKFGPNDNITREQLAAILMNYARYKGKNVNARTNIETFKDYNKIDKDFRSAISWCVANKIISGKSNGTRIDPKGTATRAEAAAMIRTYCLNIK